MIVAAAALATLTAMHFPVSTHDAGAQAAFDRGLYLYDAYNGGDASSAFAQAAADDPRLAMARWGEALAAGPDLNTPMTEARFAAGAAAARAAVALESEAGQLERGLIDAMALRYRGSFADWGTDDAAYDAAMTALAQRTGGRPGDAVKTLAAEALLERGGLAWAANQPVTPDSRLAEEFIAAVLNGDPGDVMANHLCVHLYDEAPDRAPALACARRLDAAAFEPQAEHLAHMPAHYWIETGNYAAAVASSERAYRLFERLKRLPQRDPDHDRYLPHDVYVGYSAAMMLGEEKTAAVWGSRLTAVTGIHYEGLTALRYGRFNEALQTGDPSVMDRAVRGYAALMLGDRSAAEAAAQTLEPLPQPGYVAELFLARVFEAEGRYQDASAAIDRAVKEQSQTFSGELIPLLPAVEARAGLALRRQAYADAAQAYRDALDAYPGDPRALYGLSLSLAAQGMHVEARRARAVFDGIWGASRAPPFLL
ncbi:MAG TPA: hypothetical protein VJP76_07035 [Candidatus Tumulicola sp.]|nr:hypothetical protein [Candidatus Tumulicola sp.]